MAHELAPLPYDYSALEPYIDEKTMHLHHDMHHGAYVKNLNAALEKYSNLQSRSAEDLLRDLNAVPEEVRTTFGNFNDFKTKFNEAGTKVFGSGWVWLAGKASGEVQIVTTPNQDNPLSQALYPIMGNDVWEHAYYL